MNTSYVITRGSATTDFYTAHFRSHYNNLVYSYNISHDKWGELPPPPNEDYGLVCIEGQVITVGGKKGASGPATGQIFSLQDGEWKERQPPLNIARSNPAV